MAEELTAIYCPSLFFFSQNFKAFSRLKLFLFIATFINAVSTLFFMSLLLSHRNTRLSRTLITNHIKSAWCRISFCTYFFFSTWLHHFFYFLFFTSHSPLYNSSSRLSRILCKTQTLFAQFADCNLRCTNSRKKVTSTSTSIKSIESSVTNFWTKKLIISSWNIETRKSKSMKLIFVCSIFWILLTMRSKKSLSLSMRELSR